MLCHKHYMKLKHWTLEAIKFGSSPLRLRNSLIEFSIKILQLKDPLSNYPIINWIIQLSFID